MLNFPYPYYDFKMASLARCRELEMTPKFSALATLQWPYCKHGRNRFFLVQICIYEPK